MRKVLLSTQSDEQQLTILERLQSIVHEMETGDYTESDAAVLITRDKATGILTFTHIAEDDLEPKALFDEAAKVCGYGKVM